MIGLHSLGKQQTHEGEFICPETKDYTSRENCESFCSGIKSVKNENISIKNGCKFKCSCKSFNKNE